MTGLSSARDSQRGKGVHFSLCRRAWVHATESSAKEMIRTSEAPQANNQAGTGRSLRPTRACAEATSGNRSAAADPAASSCGEARGPLGSGISVAESDHGLTCSSAIGPSVWSSLWTSTSKTPSRFAGNEKLTGLCSAGFSIS